MMQMQSWELIAQQYLDAQGLDLEVWRQDITAQHSCYLAPTLQHMAPPILIHYLGEQLFKSKWPSMRARLTKKALLKVHLLDHAWSKLLVGIEGLPPFADFWEISPIKREFLIGLAKYPSQSSDFIAMQIGISELAAFCYAADFQLQGVVNAYELNGDRLLALAKV